MEGKIKIGDSSYPSIGSGKIEQYKNELPVSSAYRISNYFEELAITALGTILNFNCLLPIAVNKLWITIVKIDVNFWFLDSGAGTYLINNKGYINFNTLVNQDSNVTVRVSNYNHDLYIQANLNAGNLPFILGISGADILNATGITPGAGDLCRAYVSVTYF